MPRYLFICPKCGTKDETIVPIAQMRSLKVECDCGTLMDRDVAAEVSSVPDTPGTYPMWSDAAGVNPNQVDAAEAACRRAGVPTEYCRRTGRVKFVTKEHRKLHCEKVTGLHDRNAGYSDPIPQDTRREAVGEY